MWKDGLLLLGKRINPKGEDTWQFPGGHLEFGETVSHCANREVEEEVGIRIKELKHLGFTNDVFTTSGRHYVTLFVSAKYADGDITVMEPDKCECWQWFKSDDLPRRCLHRHQPPHQQHQDQLRERYDRHGRGLCVRVGSIPRWIPGWSVVGSVSRPIPTGRRQMVDFRNGPSGCGYGELPSIDDASDRAS